MADIDEVVKQLAEVTDALLDVPVDDFTQRFQLTQERGRLREQAASFRERKDESTTTEQLTHELSAHKARLAQLQQTVMNRSALASCENGAMAGTGIPKQTTAQATQIDRRIAHIERELELRSH